MECRSFIRLSKEDGDNLESNSITNQKDILRTYCKNNGFDIPDFTVNNDIVKVTFTNIKHLREDKSTNDGDLKQHFEGVIEGIIEGINVDVKEKLAFILCVLYKYPGIRTTTIGEKTKLPIKSIERYIKQLKDVGLIIYSGASKTGGYFLSEKK